MSGASRPFTFVQFEFPWALGPADGRYVVRAPAATSARIVLVLGTLGAPQRRRLQRRRGKAVEPEPEATPVATARATVIGAEALENDEAGADWIAKAGDAEVQRALTELNAAIALHRVAMADPAVREVSLGQALVVRVGFGAGEQVADGRWSQARELPAPREKRRRRTAALRPQERFAALLGSRETPLACEELTLRARLDVDAGRWREAALQLRAALDVAVAELGLADRVEELTGLRESVDAAAKQALAGAAPTPESLVPALERLEAALRARAAAGA